MNEVKGLANHTIYCVKTGQPVGSMSYEYQYPPMAVAQDWFQTDGQYLDGLQDAQPRAYAAFCLGLIDNFWRRDKHRHNSKTSKTFLTRQEAIEHHWSLVRAYDLLGAIEHERLVELCHALWRFIVYAPLSHRVLDQKILAAKRSADLLAETAVAGALTAALDKALVFTMTAAEHYATAGASIVTPKYELKPKSINSAAQGPSNLQDQKKTKEFRANAKHNKLMADIWNLLNDSQRASLGLGNVPAKRPGQSQTSKFLGRLSQSVDNNVQRYTPNDDEEDLLAQLEKHMLGGSTIAEEIDEDDIVEVRTIPRLVVASLVEPQETPIVAHNPHTQPTTQQTPRKGFLSRLAGKE